MEREHTWIKYRQNLDYSTPSVMLHKESSFYPPALRNVGSLQTNNSLIKDNFN